MSDSKGPRELQFDQTEQITDRLRDLVRNYPKGLGLVKEFLQNADDAGATELKVIYDRRQHNGTFTDYPKMGVTLGPALLFINDQVFSEDDFKRIQRIGEGGKVREAARTGRFGQGFNTCYSVSDYPSLMSNDFIALFDPHRRIFGGGKNATAWRPLADVEEYWPDWIKTFEPAGWEKDSVVFSGTAFRLPLRSDANAEQSEILKEAFKDEDFSGIVSELRKIGAALLIFLRSVLSLEIREIDSGGKDVLHFKISTKNVTEVESHRRTLREVVSGNPVELLENWINTDCRLPVASYDHLFSVYSADGTEKDELWSVVTGLFTGPDKSLLRTALEVSAHEEKAIPWAGTALCHNTVEVDVKRGGLACFLPLPEHTKWPVWLHGWFDLSSNRRGITRDADVGDATKSRQFWNKSLMEHAVAKAWALLLHKIKGLPADNLKPYEYWLRPPDKADEIDAALIAGFYNAVAELPSIRSRDRQGFKWHRLDEIRDLPAEWNERLSDPLLAEGWVLTKPSLPDFIKTEFRRIGKFKSSVSSKTMRAELVQSESEPDVKCTILEAPRPMLRSREWIKILVDFCADGNFDNLEKLPLALLSDGLLHTYTTCGRLFLADDKQRALLGSLPERFLDFSYQTEIALNLPNEKIKLSTFDLPGLLDYLPEILSHSQPEPTWLISFFDYLTSCSIEAVATHKPKLDQLPVVKGQNGNYYGMGFVETPLISGKESKELLKALGDIGINILSVEDDLKTAISTFASKHNDFIWELTPNDIADNLKSHVEESCLNEEAFDNRKTLELILDYLSSSNWLNDNDSRIPFLRRLMFLPTTCGRRVAAQDDDVYIPALRPPKGFEGKYILLDTGRQGRWSDLFRALKVRRLDGVVFVRKVLLPAFKSATYEQCLSYLKWIRDDFRIIAAKLTEEERQELRHEIRQQPIIPIEGGNLCAPYTVYRPDSTVPLELLGDLARFPNKIYFSTDKDLWCEFYREYELPVLPLARDIYLRIKDLSNDAPISGVPNVKAKFRKLIDHISENWSELSTKNVEGSLTFAGALYGVQWLSASKEDSNYAACGQWPDKLWRANELVPGRLAHLCASKYPVLEGAEFPREMSDALGLVTTISLEDVIEHFSKVRTCNLDNVKNSDAIHKAAEGFYRFIGQLDGKNDGETNCLKLLKEQLSVFVNNKWWHPSQCFFDKLPFITDWAVSLTSSHINISDYYVQKGLTALGVRQRPDNEDWILMLTDLADKYRNMSLPITTLDQVHYAIRILRSATTEWLQEQEVFIPLHDRRLELARNTLLPDDPRLKNYSGTTALPFIEDNDDAFDVGRRSGAKSLRGALTERLKYTPSVTRNSASLAFGARLEEKLKSKQFYQCLRRIAYEEAIRSRGNTTDPLAAASADNLLLPQRMRVFLSPSINIETVVEIDDEEFVVFDQESSCYLDKSNLKFWLKEGKPRRIKDDTVRAICDLCGLSDQLRLSRVLEVEPHIMSLVLDEEEMATLPEGQTLELQGIVPEENSFESDYIDDEPEIYISTANEAAEVQGAQSSEKPYSQVASINTPTGSSHEASTNIEHSADPMQRGYSAHGESPATDGADPAAMYDSEGNSIPSQSIEAPTKPGHGSSRPWRDNSPSHPQASGNNVSGSLNKPCDSHPHPIPYPQHRDISQNVGQHSPSSSRFPLPDVPPTSLGHGSSKPWESQAKGNHDASKQVRMRTYVHERVQEDYDTGDSDSRAKDLGNIGEAIVIEYEKKRKRTAKQMPRNNEGYDIESNGRDGMRYIEVKSIDGPWGIRGVGVTRAQYEAAIRLGKSWWLYVVENVTDPSRKKVHTISNPFHLATEFRFDSGWIGAHVHELGISPDSVKPKIGAKYEKESGKVVRVESTTQRGQFWRVTYITSDGSRERGMWDVSWRKI